MDKVDEVIAFLKEFDISAHSHSKNTLQDHLIGTYSLLLQWQYNEHVCLAGLCHSVYGTESYAEQSISISERNKLSDVIGQRAEWLAYLFGAHKKSSLWLNLVTHEKHGFRVVDRFDGKIIELTSQDFSELVVMTLANKLEQMPRQPLRIRNRLKPEMLASKRFLSYKAWDAFVAAYEINN